MSAPDNSPDGSGNGNGGDGPKASRLHGESHSVAESHPVAKPGGTITWPVKGFGTVRLSKGVYECVLPDGAVVETFRTFNFAIEFLQERERPIRPEQQARRLKADVDALSRQSPTERAYALS